MGSVEQPVIAEPRSATGIVRFGVFEVDLRNGELRKQGARIKLQEKPFQALALLLEKAGQIVTREELRQHLWPADTFVAFDDNLNATVKRLREALGDSADGSRYIETIPRRGYRFLVSVEKVPAPAVPPADSEALSKAASPWFARSRKKMLVASTLLVLAVGLTVLGLILLERSRTTRPERVMLAVLPFKNLSPDPSQEFISDGMTEEMIAQLGRLDPDGLGVIARTSVMRYRNTDQSVLQIGRELGVDYVLEGSVRRDNKDSFITAQLIQVSDQTHLWAETYQRPLSDVFSVQRDVARRVAESLALRLLPARKTALARAETVNTDAFEAYLRGRHLHAQGTETGFGQAVASFEQALHFDPNYVMALAGLARAHMALGDYHLAPREDSYRKAGEAITKGLELDPALSDLYVLQGMLLQRRDGRGTGAESSYRRALGLDPNNADAHLSYAQYLLDKQRHEEALAEAQRARELDPLSPTVSTYVGAIFLSTRNFEQATEQLHDAVRLDPRFPAAYYFLARLALSQNQPDRAIEWFRKSVEVSGRSSKYLYALGMTCVQAGNVTEARSVLRELQEQSAKKFVEPDFLNQLQDEIQKAK